VNLLSGLTAPAEVLLWLELVAVLVFQDTPFRMLQAVPFWNCHLMLGPPCPLAEFPLWALALAVVVGALSSVLLLQFL
jgi:hypothetical protein